MYICIWKTLQNIALSVFSEKVYWQLAKKCVGNQFLQVKHVNMSINFHLVVWHICYKDSYFRRNYLHFFRVSSQNCPTSCLLKKTTFIIVSNRWKTLSLLYAEHFKKQTAPVDLVKVRPYSDLIGLCPSLQSYCVPTSITGVLCNIFNGFGLRIENSIPMVTVRHHMIWHFSFEGSPAFWFFGSRILWLLIKWSRC